MDEFKNTKVYFFYYLNFLKYSFSKNEEKERIKSKAILYCN